MKIKNIKIRDGCKAEDNVLVEFFRAETAKRSENGDIIAGELVSAVSTHNKITNAGLNLLRQYMSRTTPLISHIAVGSGSTGAAAGDTALETETDRVAILDYSDGATGIITFRAVLEANQGNGTVREFGLLNDATAGTLFARSVLGANYTKDSSLIVRISWVFTGTDT